MTKKIVITGIGATSPIGGTARDSWTALLAGESGARHLEQSWVTELDLPVTFAATANRRRIELTHPFRVPTPGRVTNMPLRDRNARP